MARYERGPRPQARPAAGLPRSRPAYLLIDWGLTFVTRGTVSGRAGHGASSIGPKSAIRRFSATVSSTLRSTKPNAMPETRAIAAPRLGSWIAASETATASLFSAAALRRDRPATASAERPRPSRGNGLNRGGTRQPVGYRTFATGNGQRGRRSCVPGPAATSRIPAPSTYPTGGSRAVTLAVW
jgi:hypothetical protein